jgi:hypothetical protein
VHYAVFADLDEAEADQLRALTAKRAGIGKTVINKMIVKAIAAAKAARAEAAKAGRDHDPDAASDHGLALSDFWAFMPLHGYLHIPTGEMWPAASVKSRLPPVPVLDRNGEPVLNKKGEPVELPAPAWLDQNRPVEQLTWAPGLPELIRDKVVLEGGWKDHPGARCFNQYRAPEIAAGDPDQATRWAEHVRKIYPDDAEHIFDCLAHRVQKPGEKINHALVLGGKPRIGKDTIIAPVRDAVGIWNCREASPSNITGKFTPFLKAVILRVNEARDLGEVDRYAFYESMKTYTAAPPDTLSVNEKFLREYQIPNVCFIVITTNYRSDGLYLPADDRRHYVAWSDLDRDAADFPFKDDNYWNDMYRWFAAEGSRHVAAWLAARDLSRFDPKAPPARTPAFWNIVGAHQAPENAELADILDSLERPAVVTLARIIRAARDGTWTALADWMEDRANRRNTARRLEECGYGRVRNPDAGDGLWVIRNQRQTVYARQELPLRDQIKAAKNLAKPPDNVRAMRVMFGGGRQ